VENVNVTVKSQVVSHTNHVSSELSTVHKSIDETRELRDKEKRYTNIIIYRVNESEAVRKEDRHDEDIHFCSQLLSFWEWTKVKEQLNGLSGLENILRIAASAQYRLSRKINYALQV